MPVPDYSKDIESYHPLEAFWRRLLHQLFDTRQIVFHSFYNKHHGTGKKIYDANPIFDAYFPQQHKLVRIIQFMPEPGDQFLSAWIDHFPIAELEENKKPIPLNTDKKDLPIPELVIDLALTQENMNRVKTFLRRWIIEDVNEYQMEEFLNDEVSL